MVCEARAVPATPGNASGAGAPQGVEEAIDLDGSDGVELIEDDGEGGLEPPP